MKIAMFGGTFDPVHRGHTELARFILERNLADRILFVPAPVPPHKTEKKISPYEVRHALLETALRELPGAEISDIECERTGCSYSIDTLKALSARYPADEILLLIGADSLANLHTWYHAKEIVTNYKILTYPREGSSVAAEDLRRNWTEAETGKLLSGILHDAPLFPCSSTEIRAGECPDALDPEVRKQIRENGIYQ